MSDVTPTVQPSTQPAAQPTAQPAVQAATQPAVQPAVQAATQPAVQAATQYAEQPVATTPVVGDGGGYRGRGLAPVPVTLTIDGVAYSIRVDPSMAGLKAIREYAGHERPKRGCQAGICGKCESKVNGKDTRLCLEMIGDLDGAVIETPAPRRSMFAV